MAASRDPVLQYMLYCGIKPEEVEVMVKRNPAYLLNLT